MKELKITITKSSKKEHNEQNWCNLWNSSFKIEFEDGCSMIVTPMCYITDIVSASKKHTNSL